MIPATHRIGASLSYLVDAEDRIEAVDDRWYAFAASNGAPELTPAAVVGRPLYAFIADRATAHLNRCLFAEARRGAALTFLFRCDAPDLRREMRMVLAPEPRRRVRCTTTLVAASPLPRVTAATAAPAAAFVTMCSWCNRVRVEDRWYDLADAVDGARLFLRPSFRDISHGICPRCSNVLEPGAPAPTA